MERLGRHTLDYEVLDTLVDISKLLNTGLDKESILILIKLVELGVQPETLSELVIEIRREISKCKQY